MVGAGPEGHATSRYRQADARVNAGMAVAFLLISILGIIVFFKADDDPVGGLFIGLACVYFTDFCASLQADLQGPGKLGERALGFFHIGTGLWLFYLMYADILNTIFGYKLWL